jgi:hypothetical protein
MNGAVSAQYEMASDPRSDVLEAFASRNASSQSWPFWRECLATQCPRRNLPEVILLAAQCMSLREGGEGVLFLGSGATTSA